jgi:Type IV secretion system pilin
MKVFLAETVNHLNLPQVQANQSTMSTILQIVFGVIGAVSVLIIVIAGFQFVLSSGDPAKVAKARNTILYAAIGLGVSASAFVIVSFVIGKL